MWVCSGPLVRTAAREPGATARRRCGEPHRPRARPLQPQAIRATSRAQWPSGFPARARQMVPLRARPGSRGAAEAGHTASRASTGGAHAAAIRDARLPGPLASGAGQSQQGPAAVRGEPGRLVQERVRPEIHACPINRDGRPRSGYRRRRRSRRPPAPPPGRPARPRGRRPCDTREPLARSGVDRACACAEGAAPRGAPHGPCRTANDTSRTRRTGRGSARAGDQRARPGRREWRPSRRPGMYRATARM
jgi:hypothetical protein